MIKNDVDDNELEPSTSEELFPDQDESATASATGAAAETASSSNATGETPADETLNVVRDVVEARPAAEASPATDGEPGANAGGAATDERDDENFSDVPFHKHPRFKQVIEQRNAFRVDATRYQNVQNFLDTSGLKSDEAADGLTIMAQAKVDPAGAWAKIKPWVQQLLVNAGEVLPDDLSQRVAAGDMTQDAAFEISRQRAQINSTKTQRSFEEQQRARKDETSLANSLYTTAADWEADRTTKDPNFAAKLPLVQREIAFLQMTEGKPKTAEGVKAQLTKAYKHVNDKFVPPAPAQQRQRPAIRPITGGHVAGNLQEAKPKSTLEIIRANRASR